MTDLSQVTTLANLMVETKARIEKLTAELETAKKQYQAIEQEDLPELMREVGLPGIRLADGTTIDLVDDVHCHISEANKPAAIAWLAENGFDGIVKTQVTVKFGRGEFEQAHACAAAVGGEVNETIHPATLKSFIKERLAAGAMPPEKIFGIHPFSRANLKKADR
jgi:hypothetical protein